MEVQLPDGKICEFSDEVTALEVAESIGSRLASAVVAAKVDGHVVDATRPLGEYSEARPVPLRLLTDRDAEALGVMRHSCAHVMARAVMRLYPGVSLAFGPTTGAGFYYDFDLEHKISEEDFPADRSRNVADYRASRTVRAILAQPREGPPALRRSPATAEGRAHSNRFGGPSQLGLLSPGRVH
jgi:hypothetical protein